MNFPDIEETVSIVKEVEGGSEPKQVGRKKETSSGVLLCHHVSGFEDGWGWRLHNLINAFYILTEHLFQEINEVEDHNSFGKTFMDDKVFF